MFNRSFENSGNDDHDPGKFIAGLVELLNQDSMADIPLGMQLENRHLLRLCSSAAADLPDSDEKPVSTDEFTREIKVALEDCFNGVIVCDGVGSLCYVMPDKKTVFKLQISKL